MSSSAHRRLAAFFIAISLAAPAAASSILELRIELTTAVTGLRAGGASGAVALRGRSQHPGTLRRERRPELGPDQLVIVVVDRNGTQLDWRSIADPRVVRVEAPDASGLLSGQRIVEPMTAFTLRIPDITEAARVVLYSTESTGNGYALALIGGFALSK